MPERLFLRLDDDPLYAPETTVPEGTLREFAVPAGLHAEIAHAMGYEEQLPPGDEVTERVLPDGAMRLIVDLQEASSAVRIVGPDTSPVVLQMRGRVRGLSITLRPGASKVLFGVPMHELAGQALAWDDVVDARRRGLADQLGEARDDTTRMVILAGALRARACEPNGPERSRALQAAALVRHSGGLRGLREVAQAVGVGERRLQQIFREYVGLSPRSWGRLGRLHDCLRRLREGPAKGWAELAVDGGFYDQSHLANEFRALCGLTPGQFLARHVSGSSKTPA